MSGARRFARNFVFAVLPLSACSRSDPPSAAAATRRPTLIATRISASAARTIPSANASASAPAAAPPTEEARRLPAEERTWTYDSTPIGRMSVVVLVPERRVNERLPVLIAMHGRGEALKGPDRGARGWVDDYDLRKVIRRVSQPPLRSADFRGFVQKPRLERLNAALAEKPYRGLIIVCPYTPDMLTGDEPFAKAPPLANFIVDELLPRVYRETPAIASVGSTAIDGVSLGGRAALSVGLLKPRAFGVIAALQAAFHADHAADIAARAQRAKVENPALVFRLVTSDADYFLDADTAIANAMKAQGLPVYFDVVSGPHDYDFNRGPGAIEMLVFHDRVLRGDPPP